MPHAPAHAYLALTQAVYAKTVSLCYCVSVRSGIKKKSKVPGVMITQFLEELPEGMSTPDFTRKPIALTIQEGESSGVPQKHHYK